MENELKKLHKEIMTTCEQLNAVRKILYHQIEKSKHWYCRTHWFNKNYKEEILYSLLIDKLIKLNNLYRGNVREET